MHAPPDVEEMRDWIEGYISRFYRQTGLYWAIADKEDDSVIGMCHFVNWDHNHCRVGVGFFLAKSHWNQGIMTSALEAIVNYGFSYMRLNRIQASTAAGNRASQRVMEKVGFQCEGRLREHVVRHGQFSDSLMYSLLKKEWLARTGKPRNVLRPPVCEWPPRLITDTRQIKAWWLTDRLRQNGHLPHGEVTNVKVTWRVKKARRCFLLRLACTYSREVPVSLPQHLFIKSNQRERDGSRRAILEGVFYRDIASVMPSPPIPRCYDVGTNDDTGFCHILLEDVSETHKNQSLAQCPEAQLLATVDKFAKIHAHWWERHWWESKTFGRRISLVPRAGLWG